MTDSAGDRRARIAEVSVAIGLLLWRIVVLPLPGLLRDWVSILALYWIISVIGERSKAWPWVTAATMLLLGGIYAQGQFPHLFEILGIGL
jgi:hypothetical protein